MSELPVDSLKEAAPYLRRPFHPNAVKFKLQTQWPKANPKAGLIVAYVDARQIIERLNAVIPHLWQTRYEPLAGTKAMICHLEIDGIVRSDVGDAGNSPKAAISYALKRAATHFGVGVSLYAMSAVELHTTSDDRPVLESRKRGYLALTPAVEKWLRERYTAWLKKGGGKQFGEVIEHGDEEGAVGFEEDEPVAATTETAPTLEQSAAVERIKTLYEKVAPARSPARKKLSLAKFRQQLAAASDSEDGLIELEKQVKALGEEN